MSHSISSRRELLTAGAAGVASTLMAGRTTLADEAPAASAVACATPPIRYKISLAGYSYRAVLDKPGQKGEMSLMDLVDVGVKLDLDAIEPTSYYFYSDDDAFVHELKRKAFLAGIEISGTPVGNNFCLPAGDELDEQIAHVIKWVDICVKLGSPAIRIFAGKKHSDLTREQAFANCTAAMKEAAAYAASKGVFLAIENHGYLTETAADLLRILEAVDQPWLGINLDTGNFHGDPYGNIARAAPHAVVCQVKTLVREEGSTIPVRADFGRIMRILREAKYRGYVTLEYEGGQPDHDVPLFIRELQKLARSQ